MCYLKAQGDAACGDVGLALVPGHAGRLDDRLQFVGEPLREESSSSPERCRQRLRDGDRLKSS